jgi:methylated-DNA-protein-cysteine methyltransferase-like protein
MKNYPESYLTIWKAVKGVRKGRVATYGQIAKICELRGHARLVGYALHNLPANSGVPWHRIINSKGMISLPRHTGGYERQKKLLEREGIVFKNEKIDLAKYGAGNNSGTRTRKARSAKGNPVERMKRN